MMSEVPWTFLIPTGLLAAIVALYLWRWLQVWIGK